jgi:hypothetical protein
MTAEVAVVDSNGEEKTITEGNEGQVVKTLVQILGSNNPETVFLDALKTGVIPPDDICLELAEALVELVKAKNLGNRLEVALALAESETISERTRSILLLAILEMAKQKPKSPIPESTPTQSASGGVTGQAPESITKAPQAPPANRLVSFVRSLVELQARFGVAEEVPEQALRQFRLTKEEFELVRQQVSAKVLAQAELKPGQRRIDIPSSLEVISLIQTVWEMTKEDDLAAKDFATAQSLGRRQANLTHACFTAYEILATEGFRLTHRDKFDRPLMTVSSMTLIRDHFRKWLGSHEFSLSEEELARVQKALATLEGFLLAAADNRVKAAIQRDRAARLREQIISSGIRVLDAVNEEMIAALPQTKEKVIEQLLGLLQVKRAELASELRLAGTKTLAEAEATIQRILGLYSAITALKQEISELEANDYDPLAQRPMLCRREQRLAFFELERKELDSIRVELEAALKEAVAAKTPGRTWKKLQKLLAVTAGKLCELDRLIAGLRPAPEQEVCHG